MFMYEFVGRRAGVWYLGPHRGGATAFGFTSLRHKVALHSVDRTVRPGPGEHLPLTLNETPTIPPSIGGMVAPVSLTSQHHIAFGPTESAGSGMGHLITPAVPIELFLGVVKSRT